MVRGFLPKVGNQLRNDCKRELTMFTFSSSLLLGVIRTMPVEAIIRRKAASERMKNNRVWEKKKNIKKPEDYPEDYKYEDR